MINDVIFDNDIKKNIRTYIDDDISVFSDKIKHLSLEEKDLLANQISTFLSQESIELESYEQIENYLQKINIISCYSSSVDIGFIFDIKYIVNFTKILSNIIDNLDHKYDDMFFKYLNNSNKIHVFLDFFSFRDNKKSIPALLFSILEKIISNEKNCNYIVMLGILDKLKDWFYGYINIYEYNEETLYQLFSITNKIIKKIGTKCPSSKEIFIQYLKFYDINLFEYNRNVFFNSMVYITDIYCSDFEFEDKKLLTSVLNTLYVNLNNLSDDHIQILFEFQAKIAQQFGSKDFIYLVKKWELMNYLFDNSYKFLEKEETAVSYTIIMTSYINLFSSKVEQLLTNGTFNNILTVYANGSINTQRYALIFFSIILFNTGTIGLILDFYIRNNIFFYIADALYSTFEKKNSVLLESLNYFRVWLDLPQNIDIHGDTRKKIFESQQFKELFSLAYDCEGVDADMLEGLKYIARDYI